MARVSYARSLRVESWAVMEHPGTSANIRRMAERLMLYETAPETSEATKVAAAHVCEKLARLLGTVIGVAGYRALLPI